MRDATSVSREREQVCERGRDSEKGSNRVTETGGTKERGRETTSY